jgi:hypothetical protein
MGRPFPETALQQVYDQRLQLNPGVPEFVRACRAAGLKTLLISGGFSFFSERIRQHLKLAFARANTLGVFNGRLTGTLFDRPWGDIVRASAPLPLCSSSTGGRLGAARPWGRTATQRGLAGSCFGWPGPRPPSARAFR